MTSEVIKIPLRDKNKEIVDYALVDQIDYENVKKYTWGILNGYCSGKVDNKRTYLHSFILGKAPKGQVIDHLDQNRLNNTRANLRFATLGQNSQNVAKKKDVQANTKVFHGILLLKNGQLGLVPPIWEVLMMKQMQVKNTIHVYFLNMVIRQILTSW